MKIDVTDNPDAGRYEAQIDHTLAGFIQYRIHAGQITLIHTQIEERFEGKGVGSTLVKGTLGRVRDSGLALLPVCPFVAAYVRRHTEYLDLVPAQQRAKFDLPETAGGPAAAR